MPCCAKIPETADKELDEKGVFIEEVTNTFKDFEKNVAETITIYQQLLSSYERVAQTFSTIAQGNDRSTQIMSKEFEAEMRKLKDGPAMTSLQMDMKQFVKNELPTIFAERDRAAKLYKAVKELKKSNDKYRFKISETEREYASKNKVLAESKSYRKLAKKRDLSSEKFEVKKSELCSAVDHLRSLIRNFIANSLPGYAASAGAFAAHLAQELQTYAGGEVRSKTGSVLDAEGKKRDSAQERASANPLTIEQQYYQHA
ncbi:hypothetical protein DQ04_17871000 [Trypanosoma grayi]|uniref:hypothetical protein n=1 Tax=Trypanosoma grayi TaxID=71804 RepID=UPI0004F43B71|nr:hypothetical protein DQ04_17871000 [Trypanosoma grayi]KEG05853.1 hypothetical protein DQ04_17871000 [Trypanosoma grayi]